MSSGSWHLRDHYRGEDVERGRASPCDHEKRRL